jgi:hypothetical protein
MEPSMHLVLVCKSRPGFADRNYPPGTRGWQINSRARRELRNKSFQRLWGLNFGKSVSKFSQAGCRKPARLGSLVISPDRAAGPFWLRHCWILDGTSAH